MEGSTLRQTSQSQLRPSFRPLSKGLGITSDIEVMIMISLIENAGVYFEAKARILPLTALVSLLR